MNQFLCESFTFKVFILIFIPFDVVRSLIMFILNIYHGLLTFLQQYKFNFANPYSFFHQSMMNMFSLSPSWWDICNSLLGNYSYFEHKSLVPSIFRKYFERVISERDSFHFFFLGLPTWYRISVVLQLYPECIEVVCTWVET